MLVIELNPCPWCSYRPGPVLHSTDGSGSVAVVCNHCGARGPMADNELKAEAAWDSAGNAGVPVLDGAKEDGHG